LSSPFLTFPVSFPPEWPPAGERLPGSARARAVIPRFLPGQASPTYPSRVFCVFQGVIPFPNWWSTRLLVDSLPPPLRWEFLHLLWGTFLSCRKGPHVPDFKGSVSDPPVSSAFFRGALTRRKLWYRPISRHISGSLPSRGMRAFACDFLGVMFRRFCLGGRLGVCPRGVRVDEATPEIGVFLVDTLRN